MNKLSRRTFLIANSALSLGLVAKETKANIQSKNEVLLHLFANGGWDVASLCDPKTNLKRKINTWADTQAPAYAGAISYAPIGNNTDFFTRHHEKMLVINGINAKTNVHSAGRSMSLTGLSKNGAGSICALHAATHGTNMPMPLLGNAFETGGLIAATQINGGLTQVITIPSASERHFLSQSQRQLINSVIDLSSRNLSQEKNFQAFNSAIKADQSQFSNIVDLAKSLNVPSETNTAYVADMKFTLAAFAAGASVACDYSVYGFDTHDNHDKLMIAPLNNITQAATLAWHFAEQLGIDDRLTIIMSSEFARTPFYNDVGGKDHWPFHSLIIMKKNAAWGNRVIGKTDDNLIGQPIEPATKIYSTSGILLESIHIHSALRKHLGINPLFDQLFPLNARADFNPFI